MKFTFYSDTHGAKLPDTEADIVLLVGDIGVGLSGLRKAKEAYVGKTVLYIPGNHEYYDNTLNVFNTPEVEALRQQNFFLMDKSVHYEQGVRFLCCTLWSNYQLYGTGINQALAMKESAQRINDFWMIRGHNDALSPRDIVRFHEEATAWLDQELSRPFVGKTVVATHFAPHPDCVEKCFEGTPLSAYFVCDMRHLMKRHQMDMWIYGHTHSNKDFMTEEGVRIISNQYGYRHENDAIGFHPDLMIEV